VGALRQVLTFFGGSAGPIDWEHVWRTGTLAKAKAPPWYRSTYWHLSDDAIAEVTEAGWELLTAIEALRAWSFTATGASLASFGLLFVDIGVTSFRSVVGRCPPGREIGRAQATIWCSTSAR